MCMFCGDSCDTSCSDKIFIRVEIIILTSSVSQDVVKFDLVSQETTDSTEAFAELETF